MVLMVHRLSAILSRVYPKKGDLALLEKGDVVLCLLGDLPHPDERASPAPPGPQVIWLYLGFVTRSPWLLVVEKMEAKSPAFERCEEDQQSLRRPGTVELRAGGPFDQWDQWEAALSLDQTVLWEVALFELVYSEELVGRFRPNRG